MAFHPKSYRPDLPMRGTVGLTQWADGMVRKDLDRTYGKAARYTPVIRASSPHPKSYRPDLPLRGYSDAELRRPTAADRKYWSEHPLTYLTPAETESWQAAYLASITDPAYRPRVDWRRPTQYLPESAP